MASVEILPEPVFNLKDPLTEEILKFIEIRLSGNHSIDKLMILAGYRNYHQDTRTGWREK
jgi:hypothetical protein